jgi:Spy/CpxP family protein refolding chaperone
MKSMNFKVLAILVACLLFFGANQLMAQQGNNMQKGPKGQGINCKIPDLTEAQQKKIEELRLDHQKNMLQFKNQLAEKETHLQTLRTADKADMAAINKTIDEIGAIKIQMMKERENHLQLVRAQLTESQKIQFDLHQAKGGHVDCGNCGMGMGKGTGKHGGKGQFHGNDPK